MAKSSRKTEFGDFQTPATLAREACDVLRALGLQPASVVEPTCGRGGLLLAALDCFPRAERAVGLDIDREHLDHLEKILARRPDRAKTRIHHRNFFTADWGALLRDLPQPWLVIGNPPWVTSAQLGLLGGDNLPEKSNFQRFAGLDAVTGKANFDISEWMLIQVMNWLNGRQGAMAMLCKNAVARKVLLHAWKNSSSIRDAAIYHIDASKHFQAAVDACLLVCSFAPNSAQTNARIFNHLRATQPSRRLGFQGDQLIADLDAYRRTKHLCADGNAAAHVWRSGVKHDCSKIMELRAEAKGFSNRLGERLDLERRYLFPMLKSSQVARGDCDRPTNWMIVTQRAVGQETSEIAVEAPKTWSYLMSHAELLDGRRSSIYRNRPRFSVFGVGDYTFAPWKVAISGFYKKLDFRVVADHHDKPIVLDDTVYFLPCHWREEAEMLANMLNSDVAREFFSAFVFWDAKRPITVDLLKRLDLHKLAEELGLAADFNAARRMTAKPPLQQELF